jgi:hypothetical protein
MWQAPSANRRRWFGRAAALRSELRQRFWLRAHVFAIAALTLVALALTTLALMHAGVHSLALRYGLALAVAYGVYLLLLRAWAHALARHESPLANPDLPDPPGVDAAASFDCGALPDALGALDEGAVLLVPLAVLLGIVALLAGLLCAGVFALFGVDVLLAVTVEVALASVAGSIAYKGAAEGWLDTALRHTWKGALAALVFGVALGAAIDHWLPEARSLPHALHLMQRGR